MYNFAIDINIQEEQWATSFPKLEELTRNALQAAIKIYCPDRFSEISILLTNNAHMQILNNQWRGQNKPTNVLSFMTALPTKGDAKTLCLGDIALGYETIINQAQASGIKAKDHFSHLLIHGYLHLQGLDHKTDDEADFMQGLESEILANLDIANPYAMENL